MELTLRTVALVALGGAIGAPLRYVATVIVTDRTTWTAFPIATLGINVLGSFLLALLFWSVTDRFGLTTGTRLLLGSGALGAFTTYSTFSVETMLLVERDRIGLAVLYVLLTTVLAILAAFVGMRIAQLY